MKMKVEAEGVCKIEVGGVEYYVEGLASGTCSYESAILGGPPEDCYPEESDVDLESIKITLARRLSDGVEIKDLKLLTKIEKALDEDWFIERLWEEYDVLSQAEAEGE